MKERLSSLDILRGLAIIFMIQVHIYHHWIFWTGVDYGFYEDIIFFFGSLAAPFFLLVSGIGFFIFITKKINEKLTKKKIISEVIKRATFIFIISTMFQLLFGYLFKMYISFIIYWSIFQVIAFSMIFLLAIPFLKARVRIVFDFFLIFFIILLNYLILLYEIEFLTILVDGTFGFVPWTIVFILGLVLGDLLINLPQTRFINYLRIFLPIGSVFFLIGFLDFILTGVIDDNKVEFFMMCLGAFQILFSTFYYYFDVKKADFYITNLISRWGKFSFSIYYFHYGIIGIGVILFPLLINEYYSTGFLLYQYIFILLILVFTIEVFLRLWKKINYMLGFEWLMNKISNKSIFSENLETI